MVARSRHLISAHIELWDGIEIDRLWARGRLVRLVATRGSRVEFIDKPVRVANEVCCCPANAYFPGAIERCTS